MEKNLYTARQRVLCELLRQMRIDTGLRQQDLADRLGRPQSFVSKYEAGERRLDVLELVDVCNAAGVPVSTFVAQLERKLRAAR